MRLPVGVDVASMPQAQIVAKPVHEHAVPELLAALGQIVGRILIRRRRRDVKGLPRDRALPFPTMDADHATAGACVSYWFTPWWYRNCYTGNMWQGANLEGPQWGGTYQCGAFFIR